VRPAQARAHTQAHRRAVELKHNHCAMEFRPSGPHWGLYCAEHGTWIKWISKKDQERLR